MEEKILNEILKDTFTLDSFRRRVQILKAILERQIYTQGADKGETKTPAETRESQWLEEFDKELLSGMTNSMYASLNEHIEKFSNSTAPLTIYFVFIPDEEMFKKVGTWLREHLEQPRLIFDYKVDPKLIGGCAIVYKGVYKDYSLRARISDNKEKIIGEFRKYFKQ